MNLAVQLDPIWIVRNRDSMEKGRSLESTNDQTLEAKKGSLLSFFLPIFNCYYGKSPNIHKSEDNNKLLYTHNPASKIISIRLILLPL